MAGPASATLGYPRIGPAREMKKALEGYWSCSVSESDLLATYKEIASLSIRGQAEAGISLIGVGDHTLYDHVLDWTVRLGLTPSRFDCVQAKSPLDVYFAMARGVPEAPALDMSKFFGTNYHYLVPELSAISKPEANFGDFVTEIKSAQDQVGKEKVSPIVLGPVTYLRIAKIADDTDLASLLDKILPVYGELLKQLKDTGVPEIQIHEPSLVLGDAPKLQALFETAYSSMATVGVPLHIATYFDDIAQAVFAWVIKLPGVKAISIDFTRGDNFSTIKKCGFPKDIRLGAGVVDGRSVWSDDVSGPALLQKVKSIVDPVVHVCVQPSSSLMFVPIDLRSEPKLPEEVKKNLAFAREKLSTIVSLAKGELSSEDEKDSMETSIESTIKEAIDEALFSRKESFAERRPQQFIVPGGYGTTTIGSFPQTPEIRKLRLQLKKGSISEAEYNSEVDKHLAYVIGIQEALGLDVFVHGEPERTDMVEYFGVKLSGFTFTLNGWVQSYGSRYVRPPIIYGDVSRTDPMTVREFKVAQSMTTKPVKGMLTGATTIINWSFPRKDISREEQAYQIALALRKEVQDLEAAGCRVIQVDDPALREGLPLKEKNWSEYLRWAIRAFRLSTSGVKPSTQIVTHLCYAEFEDILEAIDGMEADVLTIENSRSGDEMLRALAKYGYSRDIGPGVYDIHSPVVPRAETIQKRVKLFTECGLPPQRLWVNPDCGLKTRKWKEVIPSLQAMVSVAQEARKAFT